MKQLFLPNRFFWVLGALVVLFVVSFWLPPLFPVAQAIFVLLLAALLLDGILLYSNTTQINAQRVLPKVFGLGDENEVVVQLDSATSFPLSVTLIDELPVQFQRRDFERSLRLPANDSASIAYSLRPVERGEYTFGRINLFLSTPLGLLQRRLQFGAEEAVPVYPSILQMKQLELRAFDRIAQHQGIKKIRRIGHSYEFEQIKNYVRGDDYRSINWKASSRRNTLMVNQYEDERAQQIYSVIDKSREIGRAHV